MGVFFRGIREAWLRIAFRMYYRNSKDVKSNRKVVVLGANGMLGRYVSRYFQTCTKYYTIPVTRKFLDASKTGSINGQDKYTVIQQLPRLNRLKLKPNDVIINCIGMINRRVNEENLTEAVIVNGTFVWELEKYCKRNRLRLIGITTDCVFNGAGSGYDEDDRKDYFPDDHYATTKEIGEIATEHTTIRTSIIGEEVYNKYSLLEWVKSNTGKTIKGFTNHRWNGITCLQFAKICEDIISNNKFWEGIRHIFSPGWVTKYELCKLISDIFDLDVKVLKTLDKPRLSVDRTLDTVFTNNETFYIPDLKKQIKELKEFSPFLYYVIGD